MPSPAAADPPRAARDRSPTPDPAPTSSRTEVRVRPARPGELARTARLHRRALPDGFFARLGAAFLARYHASFLAGSRARLLVAERGGRVVGFLAGTIDNAAHYGDVARRRSAGLALVGLASLLARPRLAVEFLRTRTGRYGRAVVRLLTRTRTDGGTPEGPGVAPVAVLTHVAVDDEARGTGAGRALVEAFAEEVAARGVDEIRLVTPVDGGGPRFYRRLGWRSRGRRRAADGTVVEEFARRP